MGISFRPGAHISHELIEKHCYKLGIYAQKLLFALVQNLGTIADLFPEWYTNITDLFRYLNLSKRNNDRYDIVSEAICEIGNNPIEYRISTRKWGCGGFCICSSIPRIRIASPSSSRMARGSSCSSSNSSLPSERNTALI